MVPRPDAAAQTDTACGHEVPLWRLYVLRTAYLIMVLPGLYLTFPDIIFPPESGRGMLDSMINGLWVVCFLGIRYPLRMLPIFLFEFVWKLLWVIDFGLPQWMAGTRSPQLKEDVVMIGAASLVLALVIPWGYVWRHYVKEAGDRWR